MGFPEEKSGVPKEAISRMSCVYEISTDWIVLLGSAAVFSSGNYVLVIDYVRLV